MAIGNLNDLEKSLKLDEGSLQKAFDNEDSVTIDIPELTIRTPEEDTLRTDNLKKEFHTAGREIAIKEARNELELDFQGKTMDNLLGAHKIKVLKEASIEPNEKNKTLQLDLDTVRETLKNTQSEYDVFKLDTQKQQGKSMINDMVSNAMQGEFTLGKQDLLTLFNAKHDINKNEEGAFEISIGGEVQKNTDTRSLLSIEEMVGTFTKDFIKTASAPSGAGGGDDTGTQPNSMEKFTKEMVTNGVQPGSEPFNVEMQKRMKEGVLKL